MRNLAPVVLALTVTVLPATVAAQSAAPERALELSFDSGRATLIASGVTIPQIMAEWERKGGSKVVNADKIVGGLVSYEFHNVPEVVVLQSLLRSAAGYIAAPRRPGGPTGPSSIEQVVILATSRPTNSSAITMPSNPVFTPVPIFGSPDDDIPPVTPVQNAPTQPNTPPQIPSGKPTLGAGTSPTPGVLIAPVKPGTPVPPGTIIKK